MWLLNKVNVPNITELCMFKNGWGSQFYVYFLTIKNKNMFPRSKILLPLRHGVYAPLPPVWPPWWIQCGRHRSACLSGQQGYARLSWDTDSRRLRAPQKSNCPRLPRGERRWEREALDSPEVPAPTGGTFPAPAPALQAKEPLWWAASTLWLWPRQTRH